MGLKTTDKEQPKKSTKQIIDGLRMHHQEMFDELGISNALFFPKMAYVPKFGKEKVISFFPSEISRGQDIYTEFVSRDYNPEDPDRKLWVWKHNPFYETEYQTSEPHPVTGDVRYLIPIDELIQANASEIEDEMDPNYVPWKEDDEPASLDFSKTLPDADLGDIPLSEMTMRDYAAIHLNKPVSRKKWLNDIINQ